MKRENGHLFNVRNSLSYRVLYEKDPYLVVRYDRLNWVVLHKENIPKYRDLSGITNKFGGYYGTSELALQVADTQAMEANY